MSFNIEHLIDLLRHVNYTKRTILDTSKYIETHKDYYKECVMAWRDQFLKSDQQTKLFFFFVLNEVFQSTNDQRLISEFKAILPSCILTTTDESGKISTVISQWKQKKIFPPEFLYELERNLATPLPNELKDFQERPQYDPAKDIRDILDKIETDGGRESFLKRRVDNIDERILTGRYSEGISLRNLDDARDTLKEYEDTLFYSGKTRKNFEYILKNLLSDNDRGLDEIERKLREAIAKRVAIEELKLSLLGGSNSTESKFSHYENHYKYRGVPQQVISERDYYKARDESRSSPYESSSKHRKPYQSDRETHYKSSRDSLSYEKDSYSEHSNSKYEDYSGGIHARVKPKKDKYDGPSTEPDVSPPIMKKRKREITSSEKWKSITQTPVKASPSSQEKSNSGKNQARDDDDDGWADLNNSNSTWE